MSFIRPRRSQDTHKPRPELYHYHGRDLAVHDVPVDRVPAAPKVVGVVGGSDQVVVVVVLRHAVDQPGGTHRVMVGQDNSLRHIAAHLFFLFSCTPAFCTPNRLEPQSTPSTTTSQSGFAARMALPVKSDEISSDELREKSGWTGSCLRWRRRHPSRWNGSLRPRWPDPAAAPRDRLRSQRCLDTCAPT